MIIKEIFDIKEVEKVLFDPEIYERIRVNNEKPTLPTKNTRYIGGYLKGEIFGVIVYYKRKKYTTCHIQVLKAHRAALAVKFGRMALKLSQTKVLFTNVPRRFPDVIRFVKYFKFKQVGTTNDSLIFRRG